MWDEERSTNSSTVEERRFHVRTVQLLAVFVIVSACAYTFMSRQLQEAMLAAEELPLAEMLFSRDHIAPYALYGLVSLAIGWAASWLAEQRGIIALWVAMLCALAPIGLSYLLCVILLPKVPATLYVALAFAAVGSVIAVNIRAKMLS